MTAALALRKHGAVLAWLLLLGASSLYGSEYFVSPRGDDADTGRDTAHAFRTVGKGVSVLKPGDTLTVCPGEYFESVVAAVSGAADAAITIRAARPGTALIRGDTPLRAEFARAPGLQYTYVATVAAPVQGILERDTLKHYAAAPSAAAVDGMPATYFHDVKAGRLYLHTSGATAPDRHALAQDGVAGEHGLLLRPTDESSTIRNVLIDGLAACGFVRAQPGSTRRTGLGIGIARAKHCTIRRCTTFLNATGIAIIGLKGKSRHRETALRQDGADACVVERCTSYGNDDGGGSAAAIVCRETVRNSVIRDCVAFMSSRGIRFYSGVIENCVIENNVALLTGDIWEKGNFSIRNRIAGNVCQVINNYGADNVIERNLTGYGSGPQGAVVTAAVAANLLTSELPDFEPARHFADPLHLDYRLQSDSEFRGTGRAPRPYRDEVLFVRPDGDDAAAGTSVRQAWRTLEKAARTAMAGQTVYILPGRYDAVLEPAHTGTPEKALVFRRRGRGQALVNGIILDGKSYVRVEGLTVLRSTGAGISVRFGRSIRIANCVIADSAKAGIRGDGVERLTITHCTLTGSNCGLDLRSCGQATVTANIFAANRDTALRLDDESLGTLWSNHNAYDRTDRCVTAQTTLPDGERTLPLAKWQASHALDTHSRHVKPAFLEAAQGNYQLRNAHAFDGRGPRAMPIGPYERTRRASAAEVRDFAARVTTTTADIEFVSPGARAVPALHWGRGTQRGNVLEMPLDYLFEYSCSLRHRFSLTGLEPASTYSAQAVVESPFETVFTNAPEHPDADRAKSARIRSQVIEFTTPAQDPPAQTYHVATDGRDDNDGLTRAAAWRHIAHAAALVQPGDTVIVHDGTYRENVVVRATGDDGRPIVFRAATPGRVVLEGDGLIKSAFELLYKSWITLDGFYIANYARTTPDLSGCVNIVRGANHTIRRCIIDGRPGCPLQHVIAKATRNLTIENCVFRNAWSELICYASPDTVLRHNVFYGNMVSCLSTSNGPDQPFTLSHNIICDQVPKKRMNALVSCGSLECVVDEYNCYFTRFPESEKRLYQKKRQREKLTFAQFRELTGQGLTSFFANPGMPIIEKYEIYEGDMTGRPHNFVTQEMNYGPGRKPIIALFDQFFATNPQCVKAADGKPIGLDPAAFPQQQGVRQ